MQRQCGERLATGVLHRSGNLDSIVHAVEIPRSEKLGKIASRHEGIASPGKIGPHLDVGIANGVWHAFGLLGSGALLIERLEKDGGVVPAETKRIA